MKKILSITLSLILLISSFSIVPFEAFAATPEIKIGETVHLFASADEIRKNLEKSEWTKKYVKFVPQENDMYEFSISNTSELSEWTTIGGKVLENRSTFKNASKNGAEIYDGYENGASAAGIDPFYNKLPGTNPTVAVELEANKTYYFVLIVDVNQNFPEFCQDYSCDLTVTKGHTCKYYKNLVKPAGISWNEQWESEPYDGKKFDYCLTCGKKINVKTIYAVETIKLSSKTYVYDGKAHKPKVTVYDRLGNVISADNYSVIYDSYENRKKVDFVSVGRYTIYIIFDKTKSYTDGESYDYDIVPKSTKITSVTAKPGGFTLHWKKQAEQTTGYEIEYSTKSDFNGAKTAKINGTKNLSQTIKNLKPNTKYYIRLRTYKFMYIPEPEFETDYDLESYDVCSKWSDVVTVTTKAVPKSTTMKSVKPTINGFTVQWNKQPKGTNGYQIKYSTNSKFKDAKYVTVKSTKTISKAVQNLKGNTKYYVKVRTYKLVDGERFYSAWSKSKSVVTKAVKGTSLSKVTPLSKGFKASWKKQTSGTNGYQIKYSTSSKFKNAKYVTIKSTKTTSKTVKNLKAKKKYYVKVRTYKIVNGKRCYSAWSTSKAVTTKK